MSFEWERMRPNFYRRYKWAFRPEYENINAPVVAQPALHEFMQACADILEVRCNPVSIHLFQQIAAGRGTHITGGIDTACSCNSVGAPSVTEFWRLGRLLGERTNTSKSIVFNMTCLLF